jgi:hypothetical protein
MSDGAPTQYNYFSGHFSSLAWRDTVLGVPESLIPRDNVLELPWDANLYGQLDYRLKAIVDTMTWALHLPEENKHGRLNGNNPNNGGYFPRCGCCDGDPNKKPNPADFYNCFKNAATWDMNWEAFSKSFMPTVAGKN